MLLFTFLWYLTVAVFALFLILLLFGKYFLPQVPYGKKEIDSLFYIPPCDDDEQNAGRFGKWWWKIVGRLTGHVLSCYLDIERRDKLAGAGCFHLRACKEAREQGKDYVLMYNSLFGSALNLVNEKDVRHVLRHTEIYSKPEFIYQNLEKGGGKAGLLTLRDPQEHSRIRRACAPGFSRTTINEIFGRDVFPRHVASLCEYLEKKNKQKKEREDEKEGTTTTQSSSSSSSSCSCSDFQHKIERMSVDIVSDALFKIDSNDSRTTELAHELRVLTDFLVGEYMVIVALPNFVQSILSLCSPKFKEIFETLAKTCSNIRLLAKSILDDDDDDDDNDDNNNTEKESKKKKKRNDRTLLGCMRESLTTEESIDQIVVFAVAGSETVAKTLSWLLYFVAHNLKVQSELLEELEEACSLDSVPTHSDVENLPLLNDVIREVLRLVPSVGGVPRVATRDDTLPSSNLKIKKGSQVDINFLYLCTGDTKFWGSDIDVFRPSRWREKELVEKLEKCPAQFSVFSFGPRNCIGSEFAMASLKVSVASLVRRFRILPDKSDPSFPLRNLVHRTATQTPLCFVKRQE